MTQRVTNLGAIKGPRAIDAFAELLPPIFRMAEDKEAQELFLGAKKRSSAELLSGLIGLVQRHRECFYAMEGAKRGISAAEAEETLSVNDIYAGATELLTDGIFLSFFSLTRRDEKASTSQPGNTEEPNTSQR